VAVTKPPIVATLTWQGDLRFDAALPRHSVVLDGDGAAGLSPVEALAVALAGCMAMDVADIVVKGRHDLKSLETRMVAQRREEPPRRFVNFTLHFALTGDVPAHAVERAIQLSKDKYCSVWHSLRQDIDLLTSFEVVPAA
jgi:putative redox protein